MHEERKQKDKLTRIGSMAMALLGQGDEAGLGLLLAGNLDDEELILLRVKAQRLAEICLPLALRKAADLVEA